jgi:hypothetical protein
VLLAAFFVQTHPSAATPADVIFDIHLQHRAYAGEGVNHDANERAVPQARERAGVYNSDQRSRLAVEDRRAALS